MSKIEILEKAIQKAVENGWDIDDLEMGSVDDKGRYLLKINTSKPHIVRAILLDQGFARALWGNPRNRQPYPLTELFRNDGYEGCAEYFCKPWQYHLQQMVTADDPVQYLEKNL